MARWRNLPGLLSLFASVTMAMLVLAGCHSSVASARSGTTRSGPAYKGGTVYFTGFTGSFPGWIFPFMPLGYFYSVQTLDEFQYLMYRPLYWFGQVKDSSPAFNEELSLALAPTSSTGGRTVVIRLKGWKFSDGQVVNAESVIFWMNMMEAESANWGGSAAGEFPYNVLAYSAPDGPLGDVVTITFDRRYSPLWFLYNALSQITPMPEAWDITSLGGAPGSGRCGLVAAGQMTGLATRAACARVWAFDTDDDDASASPHMNGDLATYGSNPLWQVVDGPWRLSSYDDSRGELSFVPNIDYSGSQHPIISRFVERWYPSDVSVVAALDKGGPDSPDIAPIQTQDLPIKSGPFASSDKNVPELAAVFNLDVQYQWGISYTPENFDSTGDNREAGPLFRQLYIRQALQLLVNQPQLVKTIERGYGVPDYGPVPVLPESPFLSKQEATNPYPYNPEKSKLLLKSHGWEIIPEGADICTKPGTAAGDCGKGIRRGTRLRFTVFYADDAVPAIQVAVAESSAWASAGIQVATLGQPGYTLGTDYLSAPCNVGGDCSWEMVLDGGGWLFAPTYLPTGEEIFLGGAGSNPGSYNDPTANRLISHSLTSSALGYLFDYENYLAKQLPVIWQPTPVEGLFEVSKDLEGVALNSFGSITPEYWHWKTPASQRP